MRPITDIRRDRLRQMIDEVAEGNQAQFAEMIGKSRAYVGFWLTDPTKPHAKQISHEVAREVEAEMRRRKFKQYVAGWLDAAEESQLSIPDLDRMGIALTSMDQVIQGLGLAMEKQLGKFAPVLAFAYVLTLSEFPHTLPTRETAEGTKALSAFDKKVIKYLEGGIKNGTLGPFEPVVVGGTGRAKSSKAKSSKAGSR